MFYIKKPEHGRGSESAPPVFLFITIENSRSVFSMTCKPEWLRLEPVERGMQDEDLNTKLSQNFHKKIIRFSIEKHNSFLIYSSIIINRL